MVQETEILENSADPSPQPRQAILAQRSRILAKDANRPSCRPKREQHQPHQSCLAGAGRTGEKLKALRLDGKIEIAEHLRSHAVAQADVFEPYQRDPRDGAVGPLNAPLTVLPTKYHLRPFHRNSKVRRDDSRPEVRLKLRSRLSAPALARLRRDISSPCPCRLVD